MQIDTTTAGSRTFKTLVDNVVMSPVAGVNINSLTTMTFNYTVICPTVSGVTCSIFTLRYLKIWNPAFAYTSYTNLIEGGGLTLSTAGNLLAFWIVNEGYGTWVWDEIFGWN